MLTFSGFLKENQELNEALVTFGGKAYPKFGQVVILAGGAGSGKGFVSDKLLGIEGRVLDVDAVKELAMASEKLAKRIKDETGYDIKNFDMKKPENVSTLHTLLSDVYGVVSKTEKRVFAGIAQAAPDRKPNLIFDVTLKDIGKLRKITSQAEQLGYLKENIHIVWIMNDVKVAMKQNLERSRTVPEKVLVGTHTGAATTMAEILNKGDKLRAYMDGDIWIVFNKRGADSTIKSSESGGMYIVDAKYLRVKKKGHRSRTVKDLEDDVVRKIRSYAPAKAEFN